MRPRLTARISVEEFRAHYWYLRELRLFCRRHGLRAAGQKLDVLARIEGYLTSGARRASPTSTSQRRRSRALVRHGPITLDTVVTDDYKCDAETRAFFKANIGDHFHFTAHLQQFRRANAHNVLLT